MSPSPTRVEKSERETEDVLQKIGIHAQAHPPVELDNEPLAEVPHERLEQQQNDQAPRRW